MWPVKPFYIVVFLPSANNFCPSWSYTLRKNSLRILGRDNITKSCFKTTAWWTDWLWRLRKWEAKGRKLWHWDCRKNSQPRNCSVFPIPIHKLDYFNFPKSVGTRNAVQLSKQGISLCVSKKVSLMLVSEIFSNTLLQLLYFLICPWTMQPLFILCCS